MNYEITAHLAEGLAAFFTTSFALISACAWLGLALR